jgi:hypothetical protein
MTNDNTPAPAWACLDCQIDGGAGSLCRKPDGSHNFEQLARAYLIDGDNEDADATNQRHRAFDCVNEMVAAAPGAAVGFLVVACAQCKSLPELCVIAAGPLEDLLEAHGPQVIPHLEKLAKIDPRFRLMLSGTWGQDRCDPHVWTSLVTAVTPGPVIDADGRTPAAGMTGKVATKAELAALFGPSRGEPTRH